MNIFERLNADMAKEFKPVSLEDLEKINQAKDDVLAGKEKQSDHPVYVEAYSVESSLKIIRGAK